jgi:histidyl-tRNA synthetase
VAYALREQGVGKQMKAATREGARTVLLLGPDEVEKGVVLSRNMRSGEEHEVPLEDLG